MLVFKNAMLTPTARASMLVAIPSVMRVLLEKDEMVGFLLLEGLVNHFAPEKTEQDERNPVVESGDVRAETNPE